MSSTLHRGILSAVLCVLLAVAYQYHQYMSAGNVLKRAATMPRAPVIALSHGGGMAPFQVYFGGDHKRRY